MGFEQVSFEFPEGSDEKDTIEVEPSSALGMGEEVEEVETDEVNEPEVEIIDDTPSKDRGRKASEPPAEVTDEELEDYSEKVRKRIKHFSKGYHDERRAKEEALRERTELERFTQQLVEENKTLKGTVGKNQTALLAQAKRSAATEYARARGAYKSAYEAGNSDALLKAQENLTSSKIRVDKLVNFKLPSITDKQIPAVPVKEAPAEQQIPVDARANDWAAENTWFGADEEMTSLALGLHSKLVRGGVDPQSDDYYEKLNTRMREVFPDQFEDTEQKAKSPKRSNMVAPASRSASPKKVKLTRTQVNIAKRLGVPLELYAQKAAEESRK